MIHSCFRILFECIFLSSELSTVSENAECHCTNGRPWQQPIDVIGLHFPGEGNSLQVKEDIRRCVAWARVPSLRQDSYYVHASTRRELLKQFDNGKLIPIICEYISIFMTVWDYTKEWLYKRCSFHSFSKSIQKVSRKWKVILLVFKN